MKGRVHRKGDTEFFHPWACIANSHNELIQSQELPDGAEAQALGASSTHFPDALAGAGSEMKHLGLQPGPCRMLARLAVTFPHDVVARPFTWVFSEQACAEL